MNDEFGTFSYGDEERSEAPQKKPEKKWTPEPYREKITSADNYSRLDYSRQEALRPSERYSPGGSAGNTGNTGIVGNTGNADNLRFAPAGYQPQSYAPQNAGVNPANAGVNPANAYPRNPYQASQTNQTRQASPAGPDSPKPSKNSGSEKKKDSFGKKILLTAVLGLVFGLVGGGAFLALNASHIFGKSEKEESGIVQTTTTASAKNTEDNGTSTIKPQDTVHDTETSNTINYDVAEVVKKAQPSIVSITTKSKQQYQYFYQQFEREAEGAGSGIIFGDSDDHSTLYIATNHHVIEGATEINVGFCDGQVIKAKVTGSDSTNDVAVVEIPMSDIPDSTRKAISFAAIGDSDKLQVGEPAIAIGNALGYGQSVTVGYISALNRSISGSEGSYIQTDAAINPGNSGGALIDAHGCVIGINSVKYVDNKVEGMGFSIPINRAVTIIERLVDGKTNGKVYIGISGANITSEYTQIYGFPEGVYVKKVNSGSPAESAGLHEGDIIVGIEGHEIKTMESLIEYIQNYSAGTEISVEVYRANAMGQYESMTIGVVLENE